MNKYKRVKIDSREALRLQREGWKVIQTNPLSGYALFEEDRPEYGKQYSLTGATGSKCIANGNTWAESEVVEK